MKLNFVPVFALLPFALGGFISTASATGKSSFASAPTPRAGTVPLPDTLDTLTIFDFLLASLTPQQWAKIGSERGMGFADLRPDQRDLFLRITGPPLWIGKRLVQEDGGAYTLVNTFHKLPDTFTKQVRLRLALTIQFVGLEKVNDKNSEWFWFDFQDFLPSVRQELTIRGNDPSIPEIPLSSEEKERRRAEGRAVRAAFEEADKKANAQMVASRPLRFMTFWKDDPTKPRAALWHRLQHAAPSDSATFTACKVPLNELTPKQREQMDGYFGSDAPLEKQMKNGVVYAFVRPRLSYLLPDGRAVHVGLGDSFLRPLRPKTPRLIEQKIPGWF